MPTFDLEKLESSDVSPHPTVDMATRHRWFFGKDIPNFDQNSGENHC